MHSIKLIHIGDIHYPERADDPGVDWKDKAVSADLISRLSPDPFKNVADRIRTIFQDDKTIRGVLVSGDLTSRGDMGGYHDCVQFLARVLDINNSVAWRDKALVVVPGNHDVPRTDVDPTGTDFFGKFKRPTAAWDAVMPGLFDPKIVGRQQIKSNGRTNVELFSINTCIGCAEKRFLPLPIQEELHKLLEAYTSTKSPKDAFDLIGEQLDTPAILEEHLGDIEREVTAATPESVAVLLGHHALLPQARVRIDLYTELINGGRFRNVLNSLNSKIIYCHGHLHEDPIEVVTQPAYARGRLVTVSAPLFKDGFNVIELVFEERGEPIGCVVHPYRSEKFGSVRARDPIRIPLQTSGHDGALCDEECFEVLRAIGDSTLRYRELEKQLPAIAPNLRKKLELMEWLNIVEVGNRLDEPSHWQVRRIGL